MGPSLSLGRQEFITKKESPLPPHNFNTVFNYFHLLSSKDAQKMQQAYFSSRLR